MKVRLIGIGKFGLEQVTKCHEVFRVQGIQDFIERSRVIQLSSDEFDLTFTQVMNTIETEPPLQVRLDLRLALSKLFFGSSARADEKQLAEFFSSTQLKKLSESISKEKFKLVEASIRTGWSAWSNKIAQMRQTIEDADFLIAPAIPGVLVGNCSFRWTGDRLMRQAIFNADASLFGGLGEDDSPDIVAIFFSGDDAFACYGAERIAATIRDKLESPRAKRVLALLGFCGASANNPTSGEYVAGYMGINLDHRNLDSLVVRDPSLADDFAQSLSYIAAASHPRIVQIDNPDANQLQRDFGRRLVCFGLAKSSQKLAVSGDNTSINIEALCDDAFKNLLESHFKGTSPIFDEFVKVLGGDKVVASSSLKNWTDHPVWLRTLCDGKDVKWDQPKWLLDLLPQKRPLIEMLTARKVIAYVGYNGRLKADEIQKLRVRLAVMFPKARVVIYKYSTSWEIHDDANAASTRQRWTLPWRYSDTIPGDGKAVVGATDPHLALFLVDMFDRSAYSRMLNYVKERMKVRIGGKVIERVDDDELDSTLKLAILARSLITFPASSSERLTDWSPELTNEKPKTLVSQSVLGGVSRSAANDMRQLVRGFLSEQDLDAAFGESEMVAATADKVSAKIIDKIRKDQERIPDTLADTVAGLNVLCNEVYQPREVVKSLVSIIKQLEANSRK